MNTNTNVELYKKIKEEVAIEIYKMNKIDTNLVDENDCLKDKETLTDNFNKLKSEKTILALSKLIHSFYYVLATVDSINNKDNDVVFVIPKTGNNKTFIEKFRVIVKSGDLLKALSLSDIGIDFTETVYDIQMVRGPYITSLITNNFKFLEMFLKSSINNTIELNNEVFDETYDYWYEQSGYRSIYDLAIKFKKTSTNNKSKPSTMIGNNKSYFNDYKMAEIIKDYSQA